MQRIIGITGSLTTIFCIFSQIFLLFLSSDLRIHQATTPTAAPEGDYATVAAPLESQSPAFADQPTPPSITRTFPPTTPQTHTIPISGAPAQASLVNKHANSDSETTQEKDPLKITPEMANKILNMIKEKGNQFEMTHKAAAQKMQKNVSTAAALAGSLALQNKLTSPQAPQSPLKNATALQQPQGQNALVQPAHQPVAVANPPPAQILKPFQEPLGLNKGLEVRIFYFSFFPGYQDGELLLCFAMAMMTKCS